uniref:BPI2 domain-containing protein n=1 Tax=Heterorhabditis bacteriophora TaxID=37862 RepID=A0A1I7XJY5_HETBA
MENKSQDSPTTKKTIADMLIEMSSGNSVTANDDCTNLQSISEYPLPPFWQLPLEVSKGYRGGFYIKGVKYVQMTTLIHHDSIIVPVQQPIKFKCDGYLLEMSLSDLFLANGILIRDPTQCHELQKLFSACVFLIHHAISEHLLNTCGPLSTLNPLVKINRDHNPILLSCDAPPFACHKQQYFDLALGRMHGVNEVFDGTKMGYSDE